jgi:hypothetical protein
MRPTKRFEKLLRNRSINRETLALTKRHVKEISQ